MKRQVRTDKTPAPSGSYSQAIVSGGVVYTAGQGPFRPGSDEPVGEDVAAQTRQTLENLAAVLEAAGSSMEAVVKTTVFLHDLGEFAEFDAVYAEYFPDPKPARSTIGCDLGFFKVEIEAVAAVTS
ncbi:RidA family protein [Conexibacter arvalis]|uniref:2-iminobutanoate/2-iminopropanoate deaminase n=1 Tax=Conexibacter arvalis TaxID=912552 RepID=A0A840IBG4_9ACTN|nr:Rid family detoxifying hydrolase [Conexibacter arvalis]MBB4661408.1 2-iminobutanoate/2-iminopropanoate deaminase [Conexibacter arvalis]